MVFTRLKSTIGRWLDKFDGSDSVHSKVRSFSDQQQKEAAFDSRVRGIRTVPIDRIVGSVGRYHDFDSKFRLKQHLPRERLDRIRQAMGAGKPLPPVELYQIKDEYYVLDGNHREPGCARFPSSHSVHSLHNDQ